MTIPQKEAWQAALKELVRGAGYRLEVGRDALEPRLKDVLDTEERRALRRWRLRRSPGPGVWAHPECSWTRVMQRLRKPLDPCLALVLVIQRHHSSRGTGDETGDHKSRRF